MDASAVVCSPVCAQRNKELEEKIILLELQVNKIARQLTEFDEIKDEMLMEVRGYSMHEAEDNQNVQQTSDTAAHVVNADCIQKLSNDPNNQLSFLGNQCDKSTIYETADTSSRASTPELIIDEGSLPSTSFGGNSENLPNSRNFGVGAGTEDHDQTQNDRANMNWLSLDQQNILSVEARDMAEPDDQLGTRTGREIDRPQMASDGSGASQPMILLPDPSLVCPHCSNGFVFKTKKYLNRHMKVHQGIRYMCGAVGCVSTFTRMDALRDHQKKMAHANGSIKIRIP